MKKLLIFRFQKLRLRNHSLQIYSLTKALHLAFFTLKKNQKVIIQIKLIFIEAVKIFEYIKSNNRYWNGAYLHKFFFEKALLITKAFYLKYSPYFLFNNKINHFVYAKKVFQVKEIKKEVGKKQP